MQKKILESIGMQGIMALTSEQLAQKLLLRNLFKLFPEHVLQNVTVVIQIERMAKLSKYKNLSDKTKDLKFASSTSLYY